MQMRFSSPISIDVSILEGQCSAESLNQGDLPLPCRMDHYGMPLLRDQEYLPEALLEEFRNDTEVQMRRIEVSRAF